jgi:hypothetical protein
MRAQRAGAKINPGYRQSGNWLVGGEPWLREPAHPGADRNPISTTEIMSSSSLPAAQRLLGSSHTAIQLATTPTTSASATSSNNCSYEQFVFTRGHEVIGQFSYCHSTRSDANHQRFSGWAAIRYPRLEDPGYHSGPRICECGFPVAVDNT